MINPKSIGFVIYVFTVILTVELTWSLHDRSNLQCHENERQALLSFKHGVIDPSNRLSSWEGRDCCKWHGVSCNNMTGYVVKLDLHNPVPYDYHRQDYDGRDKLYEESRLNMVEVSHSLVELKHLKYLDLSWNNYLGRKIPSFFGSFQKLDYLNLSSAMFGGNVPHHLGNLSSLSSLDLSQNYVDVGMYQYQELAVDTLEWTLRLFSLQQLDISGIDLSNAQAHSSQITFCLPYSLSELHMSFCALRSPFFTKIIGNMTLLQVLDLSENHAGGQFPNKFQNMTSLIFLDLSENFFTSSGAILDELKSLKHLETLDLSGNKFQGKKIGTSTNFSFANSLQTLDLSDNLFDGVLPDFSYQLKNLKILHLAYNSFHGPIPTSFGAFPNMKILDLSGNALTASIPSSLGLLTALESLHLASNKISGPIPTAIGNLSNLRSLHLQSNQLNGQVPSSFGKLLNLEELYLGNNLLEGVVSEVHFAELSKLQKIDLSSNSFTLKVTPDWVPPFQLVQINLTDCNLGPQFPDWLHTQTQLEALIMSNSRITGSIPNWFEDISNGFYYLDLSHNNIEGSIPHSIFCSKNINYLSLRSNRLSGELPRCLNSSHLSFVDFSFNRITGSIPHSFCNFTLEYLSLSNNNLLGELPGCWNNPDMSVLDFSFNLLEKSIPISFGQLPNLQILYSSHNLFYGKISKSLKNCTKLLRLDLGDNSLSGDIPDWIGDLSELRILRLRSNKLTGILSKKLCDLEYLQILDVGDNHLSGTIPYCFGNFKAMSFNRTNWVSAYYLDYPDPILTQLIKGRELQYFSILEFLVNVDLSNNNLSGRIPEELTRLSGLTSLNLSRNNLSGRIPEKIGNLTSLESLDFSSNHISGRIPQGISLLIHLSVLNLSYNNLSGEIPSGSQLQTFTDPTMYHGNDELCGPPLEKVCFNSQSLHDPTYVNDNGHREGESNMMPFYIGLTFGFVVGFWCVCGVLFLKKTWRLACFRFVDDIQDRLVLAVSVRIVQLNKDN